MKLETKEIPIERSEKFSEMEFDIGDKGMIFHILRSKMYPNPIKAFVQELMCNARDAHREVGKNNVPIDVQIPTSFSPEFRVRDYGPGIDPDRMENIFVKYGNSTKRDSNDQTGGFGLGAKTPWAYTDSFIINTFIPNDKGEMIKRIYSAYIDEKRIGMLALLNGPDGDIVTDEKQGTKIIVACKPNDYSKFIEWVQKTSMFWDEENIPNSVRPNVICSDFMWPELDIVLQGDRWFCEKKEVYAYGKKDPTALVDGVPYKLTWDHLNLKEYDQKTQSIFHSLFSQKLYLFFNTGELPVAANREEIEYTEKAIELICQRLCKIAEEIHDLISKKIADCENLWEANVKWNKIRNGFNSIIDTVCWKDVQGHSHDVTGKSPNLSYCSVRVLTYKRSYRDSSTFRKSQYESGTFIISNDSVIVFNNEKSQRPNRRRLRTIFSDEAIKTVSVIQWPDDPAKKVIAEQKLKDKYIDLYDIKNITDYEKDAIQRTSNGGNGGNSGPTPRIWRYITNCRSKRDAWNYDVDDAKEFIKNGEGVYVLLYNRNATFSTNNRSVQFNCLNDFAKLLEIQIYGVAVKTEKKLGSKWVPLEIKVKEKIDELNSNSELQKCVNSFKDLADCNYLLSKKNHYLWKLLKEDFSKKLLHQDGAMYKVLDLTALYELHRDKIEILSLLKNNYSLYFSDLKDPTNNGKVVDAKSLYNSIYKNYPLFSIMSFSYYHNKNKCEIIKDFYDYINARDAMLELEAKKIELEKQKKADAA